MFIFTPVKQTKTNIMKTYFLIDGTNSNKVVNEFESKEKAMSYVNTKEHTENWEDSFEAFEDFKDEFRIVDSNEMDEAVKSYGSRKRNYWN